MAPSSPTHTWCERVKLQLRSQLFQITLHCARYLLQSISATLEFYIIEVCSIKSLSRESFCFASASLWEHDFMFATCDISTISFNCECDCETFPKANFVDCPMQENMIENVYFGLEHGLYRLKWEFYWSGTPLFQHPLPEFNIFDLNTGSITFPRFSCQPIETVENLYNIIGFLV